MPHDLATLHTRLTCLQTECAILKLRQQVQALLVRTSDPERRVRLAEVVRIGRCPPDRVIRGAHGYFVGCMDGNGAFHTTDVLKMGGMRAEAHLYHLRLVDQQNAKVRKIIPAEQLAPNRDTELHDKMSEYESRAIAGANKLSGKQRAYLSELADRLDAETHRLAAQLTKMEESGTKDTQAYKDVHDEARLRVAELTMVTLHLQRASVTSQIADEKKAAKASSVKSASKGRDHSPEKLSKSVRDNAEKLAKEAAAARKDGQTKVADMLDKQAQEHQQIADDILRDHGIEPTKASDAAAKSAPAKASGGKRAPGMAKTDAYKQDSIGLSAVGKASIGRDDRASAYVLHQLYGSLQLHDALRGYGKETLLSMAREVHEHNPSSKNPATLSRNDLIDFIRSAVIHEQGWKGPENEQGLGKHDPLTFSSRTEVESQGARRIASEQSATAKVGSSRKSGGGDKTATAQKGETPSYPTQQRAKDWATSARLTGLEGTNPYRLRYVYGDEGLHAILTHYTTMQSLRGAVAYVQRQNPGTAPRGRTSKSDLIDYLMQQTTKDSLAEQRALRQEEIDITGKIMPSATNRSKGNP